MSVKELKTAEYPTRYVAFDNPQTFVEAESPKDSGGFEWAVYSHRVKNKDYPQLTDGVFFEICSYQGKDYLVSGYATKPDKRRHGPAFAITQRCPTYQEAKAVALDWIPKAEAWILAGVGII